MDPQNGRQADVHRQGVPYDVIGHKILAFNAQLGRALASLTLLERRVKSCREEVAGLNAAIKTHLELLPESEQQALMAEMNRG
jgi:hypothetical protein